VTHQSNCATTLTNLKKNPLPRSFPQTWFIEQNWNWIMPTPLKNQINPNNSLVSFQVGLEENWNWIIPTALKNQINPNIGSENLYAKGSITVEIILIQISCVYCTRRKTCIFDCSLQLNFSRKRHFATKILLVA
jgi:hypothetical protein